MLWRLQLYSPASRRGKLPLGDRRRYKMHVPFSWVSALPPQLHPTSLINIFCAPPSSLSPFPPMFQFSPYLIRHSFRRQTACYFPSLPHLHHHLSTRIPPLKMGDARRPNPPPPPPNETPGYKPRYIDVHLSLPPPLPPSHTPAFREILLYGSNT